MDVAFDAAHNRAGLAGERLVIHGHLTNVALQAAIEDALGDDGRAVQVSAAADVVRRQLEVLAPAGGAAAARTAEALFAKLGFGRIAIGDPARDRFTVALCDSHHGLGWLAVRGPSEAPVCHYAVGFVKAAVASARGVPLAVVTVREVACVACREEACTLAVEVGP